MTTATLSGQSASRSGIPEVPAIVPRMTFAEYMVFERGSQTKHHYYYGKVIDVAGATYEHNLISANLLSRLVVALDDTNCRALGSDMKVMVSQDVAYYPDVLVVCGSPLITFEEALQNPVLVAEVISSSTASFDRGEKFRQYRTIPSLRHIIFLEQDSPIIEHYERNAAGEWIIRGEYTALEQNFEFTIGATLISLPLARIYRDVTFPDTIMVGDTVKE